LFVFAALAMVLIGPSADVPEVGAGGEPVAPTAPAGWRGLFAGVAVLRADRLLRSLSVSVVVLVAIYLPIEAVLLPTHYEALGQPGSMGVVIACLAMGSMVGSFAYGRLSARFTKLQIVRMIMLGTMTAIWPMALLPPLVPMAIAGALLGLWWGPYNPLMSTLVQTRVPIDQQGRVYGVQMSLFSAAPPVAMLVVGVVVEWLGVRTTYLALAGVLSVWTLILLRDPALAELDRLVDEWPTADFGDPVRPHV
jgi:MFS family permease